ncbi:MAG: peptidase C1 [Atopobiaceae bacterium]|jgi:bleomycin hydrolase|nr:peptidase C1 [Atopobiaceae bacterium]MCH4120452.1 peptidase C1 [Atopobiaceae bacterium]MCI1388290.1 peptidase C1 [Atopobiaceae bacterium]MCI1431460.1 peptidase C1 [Atopobiaceae bacterium]MCI1469896.1 peptidase C1 [Atopobiaceae bacterium]
MSENETQGPATAGAAAAGAIDAAWAAERGAAFARSRANRVARNAVTSMDVMPAARDISRMRTYASVYEVSLKRTGKPTNQMQSGRCWLFSALNVARATTMELLDVDDFELSQAYGMFYDKLEKANSTLERVINLRDRPLDDRGLDFVLDEGMGDGGYYNFAMNLIRKWGVVPKDAMPETACSKNSAQMDRQLNRLVRRGASLILVKAAEGAGMGELRGLKREVMADVYQMLAICLGEPPRTFDFACAVGPACKLGSDRLVDVLPLPKGEATDGEADADAGGKPQKARRMVRDRGITPLEFLKRYVPFDPDDYVELVSIPGQGRPFGKAYHVELIDSVEGGKPLLFLNVEQEVLEQAAVTSLKAGVPVGMACDVMQDFPRGIKDFPGVLATDGVDLEGLFGMRLGLDRATMADVRETSLTHAMTFQGVELDGHGRPLGWRVENSWGKDACKDGYLHMSADWFRTFGGEVIVRREFVPKDLLAVWDDSEPVDVAPWTAMGVALSPRL